MRKRESTLNRLSRSLGLSSQPLQSSIPEPRPIETEQTRKLKARIISTVLGLIEGDRQLTGLVKQLSTPILQTLTQGQIEEALESVEKEISKLRIDGLIRNLGGDQANQKIEPAESELNTIEDLYGKKEKSVWVEEIE